MFIREAHALQFARESPGGGGDDGGWRGHGDGLWRG